MVLPRKKLFGVIAVQLMGLMLVLSPEVVAQTPREDWSGKSSFWQLGVHHGFILIHSRDLVPVRHSNPIGLEVEWGRHNLSARAWESCLCYPRSGLSLGLWDFEQPRILGQAVSVQLFVEPVFNAWRAWQFSLKGGFGFAAMNRPYHPTNNPLNQGYSTPVALSAQFGVLLNRTLAPGWELHASAIYRHISNGGVKEPNKGINWPTAGLGLRYYPHYPGIRRGVVDDWRDHGAPQRRWELAFYTAFQEPESKAWLFSPGLEAKYSHQVSRVGALTGGAEWVLHQGSWFRMRKEGVRASAHQVALLVGHEFLLGRFYFGQQLGVYVYRPFRVRDDVYQRYTLSYRYSPHLLLGGSLKVYRHVADLLDLRVAFVF